MAQIQGVEDKALREIDPARPDRIQAIRPKPRRSAPPRPPGRRGRHRRAARRRLLRLHRRTRRLDGEPPRAVVKITPGPVFVIADPRIDWSGAPPDEGTRQRAATAMRLTAGRAGPFRRHRRGRGPRRRPGRQAGLRRRGRRAARGHRRPRRPHGPPGVQDRGRRTGSSRRHRGRHQGPHQRRLGQHPGALEIGRRLRPEDVAELERRLRDTSVYDSISVSLAGTDKATPDGCVRSSSPWPTARRAPSNWAPAIRPARAGRRRPLDPLQPLQARRHHDLRAVRQAGAAAGGGALPAALAAPQQTLKLNSAVFRDDTDAYNETGATVGVDLTKRRQTTAYRTYGVSLDLSQTKEQISQNGAVAGRKLNLATFAGLAPMPGTSRTTSWIPSAAGGWRRGPSRPITGDTDPAVPEGDTQGSAYIPFGLRRAPCWPAA
jgi:translocation and assembly module TamA